MQSQPSQTLRAACKRYGPGRLPKADQQDIGAGYASATAAIVVAIVYAGAMLVAGAIGVQSDGAVYAVNAALALPIVVPAAFIVGVGGWRVYPWRTPFAGVVAGGLGAVATYLVALVPVGILVIVVSLSNGIDFVAASLTSVFIVFFAFVFTS